MGQGRPGRPHERELRRVAMPRHPSLCAQRYFEDFALGEVFALPSRTMSDALFAAFQQAAEYGLIDRVISSH